MNRSEKRSDSRNIGVITTYISEYIFPKVIQGIDSVLSKNGYGIILKNTDNDTAKEYICLCFNDEIAFMVFQLIEGMGPKVPDDISVTGFDDSYLSANCPVKLTTVANPKEKPGEMAADLLLQMLIDNGHRKSFVRNEIVTELVIKDSCKKR